MNKLKAQRESPQLGQLVQWCSQSQAYRRVKRGIVVYCGENFKFQNVYNPTAETTPDVGWLDWSWWLRFVRCPQHRIKASEGCNFGIVVAVPRGRAKFAFYCPVKSKLKVLESFW